MFVFIASLNISGADTGFQKRGGVVIINNKTSGGGGGVLSTSGRFNKQGEGGVLSVRFQPIQ